MQTQPNPLPDAIGRPVGGWDLIQMHAKPPEDPENVGLLLDTWGKANRQLDIVIGVLAVIGFGCLGFILCLVRMHQ